MNRWIGYIAPVLTIAAALALVHSFGGTDASAQPAATSFVRPSYGTIQDASGTAVTRRQIVQFTGAGVSTVADDVDNRRTVVTIAGGGSGSLQDAYDAEDGLYHSITLDDGATQGVMVLDSATPQEQFVFGVYSGDLDTAYLSVKSSRVSSEVDFQALSIDCYASSEGSCTLPVGAENATGVEIGSALAPVSVVGDFEAIRYMGGSATPSIAAGSGACTVPTVSVAGSNSAGRVTVTTAGTCTAAEAVVATLTWSGSPGNHYIALTPANAEAAALSGTSQVWPDTDTATASALPIKVGSAGLTTGKTYKWNYVAFAP